MTTAPKPSGDIRRRWELRVLIALPAVWVLLAAVEGYLAVDMTALALGYVRSASPNALAVDKVRLLVIGIASLASLALGVAFAVAITQPMRQLLQRIQRRLHGTAESLTTTNEIQQLSNAFNDMLLSFDKFVTDSQIIKGLPVSVLVVNDADVVTRANMEAHRLFRAARGALVGSRLSELCPPGMSPRLREALTGVRNAGMSIDVPAETLLGTEGHLAGSRKLMTLEPTAITDEVVVSIRDLEHLDTIRGRIQRVDQLAALGAHVASLAHEISGALMRVQLLLDLVQPQALDESGVHNKLHEEVERAVRLLAEVRTFGQVNARERVACNLAHLTEDTLWALDTRFSEKQLTVVKRLNPDLPAVVVDRDRVIQAVLNVVTNAFEATPPAGTVTVAMERVEGATLIKIHNTGSFIPPEERQKIFTLFFTTKRSGSGFGLSMARRALLDHGGDIEVTSSPEGGTEFILRFPDQPPISEASSYLEDPPSRATLSAG
ncbi:MAG: PAS domain-containing protein [Acidobacteria bacterium]|nr:PAS domain-containing protein [Acidobacteriota bacterium]